MLNTWHQAALGIAAIATTLTVGCTAQVGAEAEMGESTDTTVASGAFAVATEAPINALAVQVLDHPGPEARAGWEYSGVDLNASAGGKFIYAGWMRGYDDPVTSLTFVAYKDPLHEPPPGWNWAPQDLNAGAGGLFIYMLWRSGELGVAPITDISFVATKGRAPPDIGGGYVAIPQDLNAGSGGLYIWPYYRR